MEHLSTFVIGQDVRGSGDGREQERRSPWHDFRGYVSMFGRSYGRCPARRWGMTRIEAWLCRWIFPHQGSPAAWSAIGFGFRVYCWRARSKPPALRPSAGAPGEEQR